MVLFKAVHHFQVHARQTKCYSKTTDIFVEKIVN